MAIVVRAILVKIDPKGNRINHPLNLKKSAMAKITLKSDEINRIFNWINPTKDKH